MEKKVVSAEENKILKKMFWNSHLVFANFNMTKMEANGFTMTMAPAVESIYGDDIEGKKAAYARHQSFFNTHAVAFNFIAGLCYALEKDCHDGKVPGETIDAIKASLMGPTAGMFDSIFFNCLRVIGAGIAMLAGQHPRHLHLHPAVWHFAVPAQMGPAETGLHTGHKLHQHRL